MAKRKPEKSDEKKLIYVISGKNASLVNIEYEKIIANLLTEDQKLTGLLKVDGSEITAAQVFDELRTIPFLSDKRVLVIKDAEDFVSENRPVLEKYFEHPSSSGILILLVSTWPSQTRLAKKLPQVGELISVEEPKAWQLPGKIAEYARDSFDKQIDKDACEFLIELAGENITMLYAEIDKLAVFAGQEKSITISHVESLTGRNRLFNCFEAIEAAVSGKMDVAVNCLRKLFEQDKSAEYTVIGASAYYFRRMFSAKAMLEKGAKPSEVVFKLKIWRGREQVFFEQLRKMSLKQIGAILEQLAQIDYSVKTGQTRTEVAVEQLLLKLNS